MAETAIEWYDESALRAEMFGEFASALTLAEVEAFGRDLLQLIATSLLDLISHALLIGDRGAARALMLAALRALRGHRRCRVRRPVTVSTVLVSHRPITIAPTRGSPGSLPRRRGPDQR